MNEILFPSPKNHGACLLSSFKPVHMTLPQRDLPSLPSLALNALLLFRWSSWSHHYRILRICVTDLYLCITYHPQFALPTHIQAPEAKDLIYFVFCCIPNTQHNPWHTARAQHTLVEWICWNQCRWLMPHLCGHEALGSTPAFLGVSFPSTHMSLLIFLP